MSRAIVPISFDRGRLVRLVSSIAGLIVLVVAMPIVLALIGGVPFSHIGVAEISHSLALRHAGDSHLVAEWITSSVLVLAWVAWAWMGVCIIVEVRAWATGRNPMTLPASRTVQSLAACLVGTALAMSVVGRTAPSPKRESIADATAVSLERVGFAPDMGSRNPAPSLSGKFTGDVVPLSLLLGGTGVAGDLGEMHPTGLLSEVRSDVTAPASSPTGPPWSVDERHEMIGTDPRGPNSSDGADKEEAADAAIDSEDPDHLAVPRTHLVRPRETLWSIAEDELGTALRWTELAECNYGVTQADGQSLDEEHWVVPGWRLLLPPTGHCDPRTNAAVTASGSTLTPRSTVARDSDPSSPGNRGAHRVDQFDRADHFESVRLTALTAPGVLHHAGPSPTQPPPFTPPVPVAPLGGGVVGSGVIRLLDRLRQVQQRHRPEGSFIRLPDRDHRRFEQRLRVGEEHGLTDEVDAAIRWAIVAEPEDTPEPIAVSGLSDHAPQVLGARIHPEVIELVMAEEGRTVLVVERTALAPKDSRSPATCGVAVAPLLVSVGREHVGPVMVNLEALGSLLVSGNPEECDAVVRALALELATSHWAGQFSVAVVGFGPELERFEGVTSHAEVDELIRVMYRRKLDAAELLRSSGYPSFSYGRHAERSERWAPAVVICGPGVPETDVAELIDVGSDPHLGMAVVAVGERAEAQYSVRLSGETWSASLELLGAVAFPQRIGKKEWDEVAMLLDTAAVREAVLSSEEPYVSLPIRLPPPMDDGALSPVPAGPMPKRPLELWSPKSETARGNQRVDGETETETEIVVAVLGPIEITGAARPFSRAWAEELVVYLAMHPKGVSNEGWATALWPDRLMAPSSLHSTASVARRSLGESADGRDHLPRSHGRLALARTVGTDWDRFVALATSDQPEQWHQALTLVRGRPFEGLRSSDWPILEGIAPAIEAAVVDLSSRLARMYLERENAHGAEWAARRGLRVSPYDERLYRMLMRAADVAGNPAGVDAAMAELLKLVADDIEPLDAVHPSTMDLYRQLSRRKKHTRS